jgi:DNA mismatch repair protein MutL
MSKIIVLDENMVNMIAAGEVIERPANVVKELLENSIDAGAGRIVVEVEDGGRKLISVADDGAGMDAEDLELAFEAHTTSKIKSMQDFLHISTMGFRGEALASICSVSRVSVVSRTADSIEGNCIAVDCGRKEAVRPCSGDCGTTVGVRDLFYKLPGRRKFLRTANTEMAHVVEHFTRIALAHCELDMTLIHNGRGLYHLAGGESIIGRIEQLLGKTISEDLLETQSEEKNIRIHALLGKPGCARASAKYQYIFLNGRYIRDKFIMHAIKEAYRGLIEPNKHAVAFVFVELDPRAYDVNVHPTKIEVRFENANLIHSHVLGVLREKLLGSNLDVDVSLPSRPVTLASEPEHGLDPARRERIAEAMADFFKEHEPVGAAQRRFGFSASKAISSPTTKSPDYLTESEELSQATEAAMPSRFLQLHNSYIVTQTEDGFVIIDQHALHERVIYEELCRRIARGSLESQRLLIPETFEITDVQAEAVRTNSQLIEKLGLELAEFGPQTMAIQCFPTILSKVNPLDFVRDLVDMLCEKTGQLDVERLLQEVLDMASCKAAIKAGQPLTEAEMEKLLAEKEAVERTSRCPHGRPTTIRFTLSELEKQFKRT